MKISELKQIIREELSKINETSLPQDVQETLDDYCNEIIDELEERLALTSDGLKLALKYLIKGLKNQGEVRVFMSK